MSNHNPNRVQSGVTEGGQFATGARSEAAVSLQISGKHRLIDDPDGMNKVAYILGSDDEWDGVADYLEDVANVVAATGRPHPGNGVEDFEEAWEPYVQNRPASESKDALALDAIASGLGFNPDWSADELEWISDVVGATGRVHPGSEDATEHYRSLLDGQEA